MNREATMLYWVGTVAILILLAMFGSTFVIGILVVVSNSWHLPHIAPTFLTGTICLGVFLACSKVAHLKGYMVQDEWIIENELEDSKELE